MNTKVLAVLAVVLVAGVGVGAAFVAGVGPIADIGGGDSGEATATPASTGTVYDGSSGGSDGGGSDGGSSGSDDGSTDGGSSDAASTPPYTFAVQSIEKCGRTCRDVTVKLTNERTETATGITVYTRIYAGNSTAQEDRVWSGKRDVGSLEAGASTTETSRVELSYSEAYDVQQNDGWITIVTTVESDNVTITFKQRRDVI